MTRDTERLLLEIFYGNKDYQIREEDFSFADSNRKFRSHTDRLKSSIPSGRHLTIATRDVDGKSIHILAKISPPSDVPAPGQRQPPKRDVYFMADYTRMDPYDYCACLWRMIALTDVDYIDEGDVYFAFINNAGFAKITPEQFVALDFEFFDLSKPADMGVVGAVVGDIVGSRFEMENYGGSQANKTKDFEFFVPDCRFTDDTVMTIAVMQALLDCGGFGHGDWSKLGDCTVRAFRTIGRMYPDCGYGRQTREWVLSDDMGPYNSCGNGAAMRVSPCAYAAKTLDEAKLLSRMVTEVTHNHPDGIKGAEAVTACVFLARKGLSKHEIRAHVNEHYYPLTFTLDQIRDSYGFGRYCHDTVPQGIEAFLESVDFDDAIRNAISIGGDSDTLAAIAGSIAEAYYGNAPDVRRNQALEFLPEPLAEILIRFEHYASAVRLKEESDEHYNDTEVRRSIRKYAKMDPAALDKELYELYVEARCHGRNSVSSSYYALTAFLEWRDQQKQGATRVGRPVGDKHIGRPSAFRDELERKVKQLIEERNKRPARAD